MQQATEGEVAVVTGSSSGIGFETSLALARNGFHTYATMRKLDGGGPNQITDIAKNENLPLDFVQLDGIPGIHNRTTTANKQHRVPFSKDFVCNIHISNMNLFCWYILYVQ